MKWCEFYTGITLLESDRVTSTPGFIDRMAMGVGFEAKLTNVRMDDAEGSLIIEKFEEEPTIILKVLSLTATKGGSVVTAIVKTEGGELPRGVRHGTYVLDFKETAICEELPSEMFIDEEAPDDEE